MSLGFLDKLFSRKEEQPLSLDIKDLEKHINAKIEARKAEALEVLLPKVNEILEAKGRAKEIIEELREHDFPEEIKDRVYKPVLTSKPLYVRGILDGLQSIEFKKHDFENLQDFYKNVLNALKMIQNTQLNQGRYLAEVFREEVLKLGTVLNRIIDLIKAIGDSLDEENKALALLQKVGSKSAELVLKTKELQAAEKRGGEIESEISRLHAEMEGAKKELVKFENSEIFKEYLKLTWQLEENKAKKSALKSRAFNLFGPLARVFRKYKKITGEKAAGGYLTDPVASLFVEDFCKEAGGFAIFLAKEQGYVAFKSLLESVEKAVKGGAVHLDAREREKTIQKLEEALGELQDLKGSIEKIVREEAQLRDKLSSSAAIKQKEEMEGAVQYYEEKLGDLNRDLHSIKNNIEEFKSRILKLKENIQEELSKLEGREVRICSS